ncbi:hypothetical protein AAFF_G00176420 [Aldrovandia affinis]|uniref:Reverse transcriptase RNase H-like domain-containing protein n=1 Tax=Aldrovandia affinis TaxID=143900 RepID=A0AAD7RKY5_9TELE|nr:hypothetical protein AAFF_G00176420 [Aldrovandia affinis]
MAQIQCKAGFPEAAPVLSERLSQPLFRPAQRAAEAGFKAQPGGEFSHPVAPYVLFAFGSGLYSGSGAAPLRVGQASDPLVDKVGAIRNSPRSHTKKQVDASEMGIGAVLAQGIAEEEQPVLYLSRKLLPRETRYSTIEKECPAIK